MSTFRNFPSIFPGRKQIFHTLFTGYHWNRNKNFLIYVSWYFVIFKIRSSWKVTSNHYKCSALFTKRWMICQPEVRAGFDPRTSTHVRNFNQNIKCSNDCRSLYLFKGRRRHHGIFCRLEKINFKRFQGRVWKQLCEAFLSTLAFYFNPCELKCWL